MTKLVVVLVVSGPLKGHKYFVKSDSKILIGRSEEANIRIGYDDFCSRRHAIIYWEGDICLIEDLDSTNGTFVNNCQVHGKIELTKGDTIGFGDTELLIGVEDHPKNKSQSSEEDITFED
ncbi:MAG: FHA domain-containing protein [Candidatus Omnitrophica bacterium]|nr:FHA domain-containing protein [Candidatus Omnitrophota bacterium]